MCKTGKPLPHSGEGTAGEVTGGLSCAQPFAMPQIPDRLFETVANYTYDWESWLSPAGRLLWVNPAVERMTGYGVAECLAMSDYPMPLIDPCDRPAMATHLAAAARGESGNDVEFRILRKDGAPLWGAISWQPLRGEGGEPLGFRTSVRDITLRKQAEEQQRQARAAAERAHLALSKFLAAATHDLRQPIQAAGLFTASLHRQAEDEETRKLARNIRQCLAATQELLDSLLDISRLDAQALQPEVHAVPLADLFERLELEFSGPAAEAGLRLTFVSSSVFVAADPMLLHRILQNFLANALRYTEAGGVVVGARRSGGAARIAVVDSGIGIAAEDLPRIFQEFTQLDGRDRDGGMGLGLAIVERMAQLLDAGVGVRSTPGRGSAFWVELPLVEPIRLDPDGPPADDVAALQPDRSTPAPAEAAHLHERLLHALLTRISTWLSALFPGVTGV